MSTSVPAPPNAAPIVVPEKQAGGGVTAESKGLKAVSSFGPSVMGYLKEMSAGVRPLGREQYNEIEGVPEKSTVDEAEKVDLQLLFAFMRSEKSNAMMPAPKADLDLSHPLSSYFISSSHNTYLSGNQLYGSSNAEAYYNVLVRGCRCVEIDVWDGEERKLQKEDEEKEKKEGFRSRISDALKRHKSTSRSPSKSPDPHSRGQSSMPTPWSSASMQTRAEPRVLHGHTLTREVPFRDVCKAIREGAFVKSDLPVILSLEVHAGPEQQEIMVDIMEECFKGMLVQVHAHDVKVLPSPGSLKNKILVKVKGAPVKTHSASDLEMTKSESASSSDEAKEASSSKPKKRKSKIIDRLSHLGKYTCAYHFKNLGSPEAVIPAHVFSLSEKKLMSIHQTDGPTLFSHNRNFLMRAYPSGKRLDSSNLDPAIFWRKGVQMVALNWQKWDAGSMLNEAQFAGSGGWILKPEGYRGLSGGELKLSHESQADAIPHKKLYLAFKVLAAQGLPSRKGDSKSDKLSPYIKCELHVEKPEERTGEPIEGGGRAKEGEYKWRSTDSKGANPDFSGQRTEFDGITVVEELSFVRFKIQDDVIGKDILLAWACIRLDRLRSGYRFVHLLDADGMESNAALLVKVEKKVT